MEIKTTRRELLESWDNSCSSGRIYLVHGRIINDGKTMFRRFKFVIWIDGQDLWESDDDEDESFRTYEEELELAIDSMTAQIKSFDDCYGFYTSCAESIEWYNKRYRTA